MLLVSLAVSVTLVAVEAPALDARWVPVLVVLTLAASAWRVWLLVRSPDLRLRRAGFWPSLLAGVLLVLISPVYGLYAFLGYIEAPLVFRGVQRSAAMVLTAAACAYAQIGGVTSPLWSWPLYALFLAVNVGIALLIMLVERQREQTMLELERAVAELRAAEVQRIDAKAQVDGTPPEDLATTVGGIFAVGDTRSGSMKRVASAVGEGASVVPMVHRWLD